jgi:PAS domain S-box-containing protein
MNALNANDMDGIKGGLVILLFIPILINLSILLYASITLPSNRVNSGFMLFVFVLLLWQISDLLIRISSTAENAAIWAEIGIGPILFVSPLAMLFGLRFAHWHKKINPALLFAFLFLIPVLLLLGVMATPDEHSIIASKRWGWIANPKTNGFVHAVYYWLSLQGFACMILFWVIYMRKRRDPTYSIPSLLLAIGFTIPTLGGIAWQVIGPLLFHANDIPITAPLVSVFSVLALLAMTKYRMLDYSPRHQWKSIVNLTREGILIVDKEDRIMYANTYFCNMLGYDFTELYGKKAGYAFLDQSSCKTMACIARKMALAESGKAEIKLKAKNGEYIWILFSSSPYLDTKGKVIGSLGIHTDINNLKVVENKLKSKVEELNMFFYKASHDLKSPAASIKGLVALYNSGSDVRMEEIFSAIEKSVNRLMDSTDRLSQIAIISQRRLEQNEIQWNQIVAEILNDLRSERNTCCTTVEIDVKNKFHSDLYLIGLILRIAITNAYTYRDSNKSESKVLISVGQEEQGVRIVISDNGYGIPEELQQCVFKLFTRGEQRSGAGLGLYTLKQAVDKLGGHVSLKSVSREGTRINILLPERAPVGEIHTFS